MKYYISDLHIGHANVLRYDGRPFADLDTMHAEIIRRWNAVVGSRDEVYILGDFAWNKQDGEIVLAQLAGHKYLVTGNHDHPSDEMRRTFRWIKDYAEIRDSGTALVLSHYPIAHWNGQYQGAVHLYGHVHATRDYTAFRSYQLTCMQLNIPCTCFNVGCMLPYMDYTPRTLEQIMQSDTGC